MNLNNSNAELLYTVNLNVSDIKNSYCDNDLEQIEIVCTKDRITFKYPGNYSVILNCYNL